MNSLCATLGVWVLAGVAISGCAHSTVSPSRAQALDDIARWEDRRSLGDGRLTAWAREAEPAVRGRALLALARIQDPATLEVVEAALKDGPRDVQREAAFAAGVLALSWEPLTPEEKERLGRALLALEYRTHHTAGRDVRALEAEDGVYLAVLTALGQLGTPDAVARLGERLSLGPIAAGRAAVALGVAALRGASLTSFPLTRLAPLLQAAQPEPTRYGGAYALASMKRPAAAELLRACLADAAPDVRAVCAKGMGDIGGPEDAAVVGALLTDAVPRVAAESARSLAKLAARCSGDCTPLDALARLARGGPATEHAVLALAQQGLPEVGRRVFVSLRRALAENGMEPEDAANLDCRLAAAMDRQRGRLDEVLRCGGGRVPESSRLALGLREVAQSRASGREDEAVRYLTHPEPRVRLAALAAVAARPVPGAVGAVRALLGGEDAVVAAAAASTAAALKDTEALPGVRALAGRVPREPELAEPVAEALGVLAGKDAEGELRPWLVHPRANVRRVAAEALTRLTGQPVRALPVEGAGEGAGEGAEDAHRPEPAKDGARLTFRTRKGDFTVALDAEAPLTSGNLLTLARRGYFRGVGFHRVVPDFVAQGGDPRGDGEGGPGYALRCEITHRRYARGTLGMALSGKDTGGSQFFVTHSPQPHLDGRYTAFGEVTSGLEVVDRLLEGDTLIDVTVSP